METVIVVRDADLSIREDIDAVLGGRRPRPTSCWCQRFLRPEGDDHRAALHAELRSARRPIGIVAYDDDRPAGWSRVAPRAELPGILGNRALTRVLDEPDDAWWITCFTVLPEHRGRGVGRHLLGAAIDRARDAGGRVLDGHPVDVAGLSGRPSASALFTGTLSTFLALGFVELGRTYPTRPVMRHHLGA